MVQASGRNACIYFNKFGVVTGTGGSEPARHRKCFFFFFLDPTSLANKMTQTDCRLSQGLKTTLQD